MFRDTGRNAGLCLRAWPRSGDAAGRRGALCVWRARGRCHLPERGHQRGREGGSQAPERGQESPGGAAVGPRVRRGRPLSRQLATVWLCPAVRPGSWGRGGAAAAPPPGAGGPESCARVLQPRWGSWPRPASSPCRPPSSWGGSSTSSTQTPRRISAVTWPASASHSAASSCAGPLPTPSASTSCKPQVRASRGQQSGTGPTRPPWAPSSRHHAHADRLPGPGVALQVALGQTPSPSSPFTRQG